MQKLVFTFFLLGSVAIAQAQTTYDNDAHYPEQVEGVPRGLMNAELMP